MLEKVSYNIVNWGDKGGVGKSTLSQSTAVALQARLYDLDPQEDTLRWGEKFGYPVQTIRDPRTVRAALMEPGLKVVDCPLGQGPTALMAVEMADLLIIPTKSGDADMVALGRGLKLAQQVRAKQPNLKVGIVLNLGKNTGRVRGVEMALKAQSGSLFEFLGSLAHRDPVEAAYAAGKTLVQAGGPTAYEFKKILESIQELMPNEVFESLESNDSNVSMVN